MGCRHQRFQFGIRSKSPEAHRDDTTHLLPQLRRFSLQRGQYPPGFRRPILRVLPSRRLRCRRCLPFADGFLKGAAARLGGRQIFLGIFQESGLGGEFLCGCVSLLITFFFVCGVVFRRSVVVCRDVRTSPIGEREEMWRSSLMLGSVRVIFEGVKAWSALLQFCFVTVNHKQQ